MNGEEAFYWICRSANVEESVAALKHAELRELHAFLSFLPEHGIPALVRGLVRDAAAEKFLTTQD
jgi:hypothetical protein